MESVETKKKPYPFDSDTAFLLYEMSHPKLLMLDEPSMGLAPLLVEQIFEIIKNLNKQGSTILLVEQNAQMALSVAHRGYVLETGKIVTTGTGEELIRSPEIKKAYLGG